MVGAHAVAFYSQPRYTQDLDLCVSTSKVNGERLMRVLHKFGSGGSGVTLEQLTSPGNVRFLGMEPTRLDLLTSFSGMDFETAWVAREGGLLVQFISLADLLRNKSASGRPKDLADVDVLSQHRA